MSFPGRDADMYVPPPRTPEQRITRLEKQVKMLWIAAFLVAALLLLEAVLRVKGGA